MPVAEPDVSSTFIAALKLVVEEAEFRLCGQATATNGSVSRETIVVSNDRPEVGNLDRNRPIESADLRNCMCMSDLTLRRHQSDGKRIAYHDIATIHDPRLR